MKTARIAFTFGLLTLVGTQSAVAVSPPLQSEAPTPRQYGNIPATETTHLIAKVIEAQNRLRAGEAVYFRLLSGAPASYDMTLIPPREAFLAADFSKPFSIERLPHGNANWKPYRLILTPNGYGELLWDVEVVIGNNGQVEKVQMLQRPPHPF